MLLTMNALHMPPKAGSYQSGKCEGEKDLPLLYIDL